MTATAPRLSATVCVLADDGHGLVVLMVRRSPTARFMGGAWAFPGGVVDDLDRSPRVGALIDGADEADRPWLATCIRELVEEIGLWLTSPPFVETIAHDEADAVWTVSEQRGIRFDASKAALIGNWITPAPMPIRFDARFYAVTVPQTEACIPDDVEIDAAEWLRPSSALAGERAGEVLLPFPTHKTLEVLAGFESAEEVVAHFPRAQGVEPIQPRMRIESGKLEILVPGEAGFEDIDESVPVDLQELRRAARAARLPEAGP